MNLSSLQQQSHPNPKSIAAVILAGGYGRRMGGVNKALLDVGGESFLVRQIRLLGDSVDEIIVVANERAAEIESAISAAFGEEQSVRIVPDLFVGEGPLAGLHAGLYAATACEAWVIGCDHPYIDTAVLTMLSQALNENAAYQAVLPVIQGELQPLYAVYKKDVGEAAKELLENGQRRLLALLDRIAWRRMGEQAFTGQGMPLTFAYDVDTPEQYERVLRTYADSL